MKIRKKRNCNPIHLYTVIGIRLPGRESRLLEKPYSNIAQLITAVSEQIHRHYSDKPVALFGHRYIKIMRVLFITIYHGKYIFHEIVI